jgi:ATP-dependent exoDNAse (exonuclease V) beta subunit
MKITLISLFSSIANDNYRNNNINHFEGYYASVIYAYFAGCGVELIAEDVTNRGRIDLTLKINNNIYIVEFKMGKNNGLKQIKDKEYHLKYLSSKKNIYIIGISFDEAERNIGSFEWEKVEC